ncbi:MAG: class I SAM-dependent methyltransferase [Anaerolineae bacterium]
MQGYGEGFAEIYNIRWTHFVSEAAPRIKAFYEETEIGLHNRKLLDLACGTGQLAIYFLDHGYEVVGLDLSPAMLVHARKNAEAYIQEGRARFIEADAADYNLKEQFGLVTSTFDALNHLPDMNALTGCFRSTHKAVAPGGWFIFDLNTRFGLRRWAGISIQEEEDLVLITRGVVVEEEDRAYTQISGFLKREDGLYKRFSEVAYNTIFDLDSVDATLRDTGFEHVHFARFHDLATPLEDPEAYGRVFIVAQK